MDYDLILEGGTVIDGTGAPRVRADVGVRDGRIAGVGRLDGASARRRLDVAGLVVAPGFIDSHAHDDWAVLADPDLPSKTSQGVTTVINGNCGLSLAPLVTDTLPPPLNLLGDGYRFEDFAAYRRAVEQAAPAVNVASMVGHSTLRVRHVPDLQAAATPEQIAAMRGEVEAALRAGALGVSSGTFYPPAAAAPESELIAVCEPLSRLGGVYATHMRDEGDAVMQAIDESLRIGAAVGAPVVISHHKLVGQANHGRSVQTLAHIRAASQRQAVCLDCYPYDASSTMLRPERTLVCDRIFVTWSGPHPQAGGRYLEDIARDWGCSRREAAQRLLPGGAVYFIMHEDDVRRILAYDDTMVGSDGLALDARPHPRLWGTFPRVLGHYARDAGLFSLETAVHKMTGLTAMKFGLSDRGQVRPGAHADLVVFDPATVAGPASYTEPTLAPEGIHHVFVAGTATRLHGGPTGERPGTYVVSSLLRDAA